MATHAVTSQDFNQVVESNDLVFVDFWATWCGPCRMQGPILEDLKKTIGDKANIVKVDIDNNQALAAQYNVQSVPTLILFQSGQPIWRGTGVHRVEQLLTVMKDYVG